MKLKLLLFLLLPAILFAQLTPPSNYQLASPEVSYLRGFGDTIQFTGYANGSPMSDQYLANGAIFSGYSGSGLPVTYDYGTNSFGYILHSDDWYHALKMKFVNPADSTQAKYISKLSFLNPINPEIDYINVRIYNKDAQVVASYLSVSPEWVSINVPTANGAYAVFDDSFQTAYVIDNIIFSQGEATAVNEAPSAMNSVVFPNPFTSSTAIMINPEVKLTNATLEIFDALGRRVMFLGNISKNSVIINRGNLAPGMYHYSLMQSDVKISAGMLVVE